MAFKFLGQRQLGKLPSRWVSTILMVAIRTKTGVIRLIEKTGCYLIGFSYQYGTERTGTGRQALCSPSGFVLCRISWRLEPIQDLPVRRIGGDFFAPQGKKPPEYLLYYKVFSRR